MITRLYKEKLTVGPNGDTLANTPGGTLSIGPAFNIDLVSAKQGCVGCDKNLTSLITVNSQNYSDAVP